MESQQTVTDDEELIEELRRDDGEEDLPEGRVLVPSSSSRGSGCFHTDPDCQYVSEKHSEWDREMAEEWGMEECVECSDTKTSKIRPPDN